MKLSNFRRSGRKTEKRFIPLWPKLMKKMGDECCAGETETSVSTFDVMPRGAMGMKNLSTQAIMAKVKEDKPQPKPEPEPTPDPEPEPEPTPEPEPEVVKPDVIDNTEAQNEIENTIVNSLVEGNKTVTIDDGVINNITIPEEVSVIATIHGEFQNGATIVSNSPKSFTIENTSEEPIDISVEAQNTVYLRGKYNNIYLNGKTLGAASSQYAEVYGTISIATELQENPSITANFVGDDAKVVYLGENPLSVSNANEVAGVEVYAPNSTVTMTGKYKDVVATVSDNTLILKESFHAKSLNLKKGKIVFYGVDIKDFVDDKMAEGTSYEPMTFNVPETPVSKMSGSGGIYNLTEDVIYANAISFGLFGNGKFRYNLNGHNLTCGNARNGSLFVRGTATVNIYGHGKFVNGNDGYGVWVTSENATVNVYGGDFEAYTHVLYCEKGNINVYGGSFKLLSAPDLDVNGHEKFLLNCFDANYTAGIAKIKVYGGKFYNFNPAVSYSEPNGPVSFVAEGYHVVESVEDGVKVYTVVAD